MYILGAVGTGLFFVGYVWFHYAMIGKKKTNNLSHRIKKIQSMNSGTSELHLFKK